MVNDPLGFQKRGVSMHISNGLERRPFAVLCTRTRNIYVRFAASPSRYHRQSSASGTGGLETETPRRRPIDCALAVRNEDDSVNDVRDGERKRRGLRYLQSIGMKKVVLWFAKKIWT